MIVLALDPSLREFGWVLVNTVGNNVLRGGCIQTGKLSGKVGESDTSRLMSIATQLSEICEESMVDEIWSEVAIGSKSSNAAKALQLCKGMIIGVAAARNLKLQFCTPQQSKKALTGNPAAEKEEVCAAVKKKLGVSAEAILKGPKYERFAIADSLAAFLYFLDGAKTNTSTTGS